MASHLVSIRASRTPGVLRLMIHGLLVVLLAPWTCPGGSIFAGADEVSVTSPHPDDLAILRAAERLLSDLAQGGDPPADTLRQRVHSAWESLFILQQDAKALVARILTVADLPEVNRHNAAMRVAQVEARACVEAVKARLVALGAAGEIQAEAILTAYVDRLLKWAGAPPPEVVDRAVTSVVNDSALPEDVQAALRRVSLVWDPAAPRERSYSVWFHDAQSLSIGPAFVDLPGPQQRQLLLFEFGKLLYANFKQQQARDPGSAAAAAANEMDRYAWIIPSALHRLPDVHWLTDDDGHAAIGYAYYHYVVHKEVLRTHGLSALVDAWDTLPPQDLFRPDR